MLQLILRETSLLSPLLDLIRRLLLYILYFHIYIFSETVKPNLAEMVVPFQNCV
jgi:hypothetical protein